MARTVRDHGMEQDPRSFHPAHLLGRTGWSVLSLRYSEETAGIIDEETKQIIDKAYNRAVQILSDNIDKLHAVAAVLLECVAI